VFGLGASAHDVSDMPIFVRGDVNNVGTATATADATDHA